MGPTRSDSSSEDAANQPRVRWGPISPTAAAEVGALAGCESVLLQPDQSEHLSSIMDRVRALIPSNHFPIEGDTPESIAKRLASSEFLDAIHVLKGGKGPSRIALNSTTYPQPRRVTWSEKASTPLEPEDDLHSLYAYTQFARHPEDWRCRLMPPPICDLKRYLHSQARSAGVLSGYFYDNEPTACQVMFYYGAFRGSIGRHRDNFNTDHYIQHLANEHVVEGGHSPTPDENSQMANSDVLIWTDGNAGMNFHLSFPPAPDRSVSRDKYICTPTFTIPCAIGTLLVFKAIDDLNFCHEASFPSVAALQGNSLTAVYRVAYVFRWLKSVRVFSASYPFGMLPPPSLATAASTSKKQRLSLERLAHQLATDVVPAKLFHGSASHEKVEDSQCSICSEPFAIPCPGDEYKDGAWGRAICCGRFFHFKCVKAWVFKAQSLRDSRPDSCGDKHHLQQGGCPLRCQNENWEWRCSRGLLTLGDGLN